MGRLAGVERIGGWGCAWPVLFPVEAIFWLGFALPIAWLIGIARAVLLVLAWTSLD